MDPLIDRVLELLESQSDDVHRFLFLRTLQQYAQHACMCETTANLFMHTAQTRQCSIDC